MCQVSLQQKEQVLYIFVYAPASIIHAMLLYQKTNSTDRFHCANKIMLETFFIGNKYL